MIRKCKNGQADNLWFSYPKITFFSSVFAVFSGTAHELMVPAKLPNTHPRPHLMPEESTDLFNGAEQFQAFKMSLCIKK